MDELKLHRKILYLLIILNLGSCLINLYQIYSGESIISAIKTRGDIQEPYDCQNKSLSETSKCLSEWVDGFYNYTARDDDISRSLDDIKKNGGDCYDYNANVYVAAGEKLGFNVSTKSFPVGKSWHMIALISNDEGYCLLDQNNKPSCFLTKNITKEDGESQVQ